MPDRNDPDKRSTRSEQASKLLTRPFEAGGVELVRDDLRAPLESLRATLHDLQRSVSPTEVVNVRRGLEVITASIQRLEILSNHAPYVHGTDKLALRREPAQLEDLVRLALHRLHADAVNRRVRLRWLPSEDRAWICCDHDRVVIAISDMLRGAMKTSRAGGEIVLRTWCSGTDVGVEMSDHHPRPERARVLFGMPRSTPFELALAYCTAWAVAMTHGGRFAVDDLTSSACMLFALPRGLGQ
jgi:signal transduction histidine kinase